MRANADIPLVLVADDEPNDVDLVRHALALTGARNNLVVLSDGAAVMNYLQRWLAVSDGEWIARGLLLLDLHMPRANGTEVLRWIRAQPRLQNLYVLVLTGSSNPRELQEAQDAGATRCVMKQTVDDLRRALLEALSGCDTGPDKKVGPN